MSVLTEQRDESAWQSWRAAGLGATDIADAVNGTYGGAYAVVARKLGVIPPEPENDAMRRGTRWQPTIADAVHVLTGLYVVGEETWCQHPEHPVHRATVDGFLAEHAEVSADDVTAILEIKTRGTGVRPNRDRWADQVQWQLWVSGLSTAIIAEATIDDDLDVCRGVRLLPVEADPSRQALLVDIARELWDHICDHTLPDPDTPSALPVVKAVHPYADPDAETVDLTDLTADVARFHHIKAAVKAATDERDELEARIRDAIGDALKGTCDGFTVSVSAPARVLTADAEAELLAARPDLGRLVLDRDRAKAEAPSDYEAARRAAGSRRLTVKETP